MTHDQYHNIRIMIASEILGIYKADTKQQTNPSMTCPTKRTNGFAIESTTANAPADAIRVRGDVA